MVRLVFVSSIIGINIWSRKKRKIAMAWKYDGNYWKHLAGISSYYQIGISTSSAMVYAQNKTISNKRPIKMGLQNTTYSIQQSIYMKDSFCVLGNLETHLQEGFSFESCCWRRLKMDIDPFACSAGSCILGKGYWRPSKINQSSP